VYLRVWACAVDRRVLARPACRVLTPRGVGPAGIEKIRWARVPTEHYDYGTDGLLRRRSALDNEIRPVLVLVPGLTFRCEMPLFRPCRRKLPCHHLATRGVASAPLQRFVTVATFPGHRKVLFRRYRDEVDGRCETVAQRPHHAMTGGYRMDVWGEPARANPRCSDR
jgi:hypothetical protein